MIEKLIALSLTGRILNEVQNTALALGLLQQQAHVTGHISTKGCAK
ncbi:hypothetical protein [Sulfurovum sp.]|nr:hypothetical protein [Sulfurovum sp.]